ncbi:MAG: nucleotidyl transferase AbiEii/AbiGii toxin family protein, partial [Chloroflexi bacterium]|nr:nucleotidyl transferase AbiEii/AbiGii toxin family protein [Chloroflexota bacterium]
MRYATAGAFRTALEQRLTARNQETGVPIVRLRKLVVFDRLLARLMNVAPDRWILKGAVALHFRVGLQFRTTRDIDLGRQDSEEEATADFIAAQSAELGDYFTLAIERTRQLDQAVEVFTVRYHVAAELAGRLFEDVTVDVGFGDPLSQDPELVCGPDLLSFAGIVPAEVPVLPLEEHIAEKLHA